MSIIAGSRDEFTIAATDRLVPYPQILIRTREEICEHQIRIASIGPQPIKKQCEATWLSRVREQVVNLDPVDGSRLPILRFGRISRDRQSAICRLLIDNLLRR